MWDYEKWQSGEPYAWGENVRTSVDDSTDFHVDLGCGTMKKGRIGVDKFAAPGVNVLMDFDKLEVHSLAARPNEDAPPLEPGNQYHPVLYRGLPFPDDSIKSIVSHHVLEHVGDGLPRLLEECHRVLEPGGIFRVIVPLFPSYSAVIDPDHKRFFVDGSFEHMLAYSAMGFAVPYLNARFEVTDKDTSPPVHWTQLFTPEDAREMRVTLKAVKPSPMPAPFQTEEIDGGAYAR